MLLGSGAQHGLLLRYSMRLDTSGDTIHRPELRSPYNDCCAVSASCNSSRMFELHLRAGHVHLPLPNSRCLHELGGLLTVNVCVLL